MSQIKTFLNKHSTAILWLSITLYFIIFSILCIWKYFQFGYNSLDLAIFNQVFFNSAQGHLFDFTIHPNSFLGDHFALIIPLLLPFYLIFQHPISLLIFQSLVLSLSAWPIYLISKKLLPSPLYLLPSLIWLLNPFVQNINIFEFHLLPFAIFFLLFVFYFYQKNNYFAFLGFCVLALLVREDVTLVIFMFSILALIEKRTIKWKVWPALMSIIWFILAMQVISHFTPSGSYKFFYYYSWLGANLGEITSNFFLHPLNTLKHVLSLNNILFTLVLFLPFSYLNLLKLRYLLLALPIYLQIILGGSSNSAIVLKVHYVSLFLPALFIALIYGIQKLYSAPLFFRKKWCGIYQKDAKTKLLIFLQKYRGLVFAILIIATIYGCLTLGPLVSAVYKSINPTYSKEVRALKTEFIKAIPPQNSIAATYEFLTSLSSRPEIYSLHYAFIGKKQFTNIDYELPPDLDALLVDFDDLLTYGVQFPNSKQWQAYYYQGDDNLRKLIEERELKVTKIVDSLALFERSPEAGFELYKTAKQFNDIAYPKNIELDNGIKFLGWIESRIANPSASVGTGRESRIRILPISLYFQTTRKLDKNYQLKLALKNKNGQTVHEKLYPLAYGLYPTSEWQTDEVIKINYWFLIPQKLPKDECQIELQLISYQGFLTLDNFGSAVMKTTQEDILTPTIQLTEYSYH